MIFFTFRSVLIRGFENGMVDGGYTIGKYYNTLVLRSHSDQSCMHVDPLKSVSRSDADQLARSSFWFS